MPTEVARQLRSAGIDAVCARDLHELGSDDSSHIERANHAGCVLCTHDSDFLRFGRGGVEHAGIAFMPQSRASIGAWVRRLRALHVSFKAVNMLNRVMFLSRW